LLIWSLGTVTIHIFQAVSIRPDIHKTLKSLLPSCNADGTVKFIPDNFVWFSKCHFCSVCWKQLNFIQNGLSF
jgi:hypothetical protein